MDETINKLSISFEVMNNLSDRVTFEISSIIFLVTLFKQNEKRSLFLRFALLAKNLPMH